MEILGLGLSRTGTTSLNKALEILGYQAIHYHPHLLRHILEGQSKDFRVYDGYDAVTDIPAAFYYREILDAYPNLKGILTIREVESWYHSMYNHCVNLESKINSLKITLEDKVWLNQIGSLIHEIVYGSRTPNKIIYQKKFLEHNDRVIKEFLAESLLVMDIFSGDGWDKLCCFLGKRVPNMPFPCLNKG